MWRGAAADERPNELSWWTDGPFRCGCKVENRCDGDLDRGLRGRHVMHRHTECARVRSTFVRRRMVVTAEEQRYQRKDDTKRRPDAPQELPPPLHTRTGGYRRWRSSSNRRRAHIVRQLGRPPALGPRRRAIDRAVGRTLDSWFRSALRVPAEQSIELLEWVSMDSRAVPHSVWVLVGTGRARHRFVIDKASERIALADVHPALPSLGLRAHARHAAPA